MQRKLLVTGANGFIGSNIISELMSSNTPVIAMTREKSNIDYLKNHNKITIEWFGTKTTFLSRTDPRNMMGSWQARHFVQKFDADLVGWV